MSCYGLVSELKQAPEGDTIASGVDDGTDYHKPKACISHGRSMTNVWEDTNNKIGPKKFLRQTHGRRQRGQLPPPGSQNALILTIKTPQNRGFAHPGNW